MKKPTMLCLTHTKDPFRFARSRPSSTWGIIRVNNPTVRQNSKPLAVSRARLYTMLATSDYAKNAKMQDGCFQSQENAFAN